MTGFAVVLVALVLGDMPQPPGQVRYAAEKGEVTFDHAAHLARREKCRACHGEGAAAKIEMGKKKAHELCLGCHGLKHKGPTGCTECHVEE